MTQGVAKSHPDGEPNQWKQRVSETLRALQIIPDKFNGKVVVVFKEGGVSYLEKTETLK